MVQISKAEQKRIEKRFSDVFFKSTKHRLYVEPRVQILDFLRSYRKTH